MSMRIHRRAFAAGIAVIALGAAGLALASVPTSNGVINTCYTRSGSFRVIDTGDGQTCRHWERPLSWNQSGGGGGSGQAGPAGPAGPAGSVGPAGAPGAKGATGAAGAAGAPGAKGDPGAAGAAGATGPPGATGAAGANGDPGVKGDTGNTGPAGPATLPPGFYNVNNGTAVLGTTESKVVTVTLDPGQYFVIGSSSIRVNSGGGTVAQAECHLDVDMSAKSIVDLSTSSTGAVIQATAEVNDFVTVAVKGTVSLMCAALDGSTSASLSSLRAIRVASATLSP